MKILLALFLLSYSAIGFAEIDWTRSDFEYFGDWRVKKTGDRMDPTSMVVIQTRMQTERTQIFNANEFRFGFVLAGGSALALDADMDIGRNYWPYCEFNSGSYSVDGEKSAYISTIEVGGSCKRVSLQGSLIKAFLDGRSARIRINHRDGNISLEGFEAAWSRALELSK